MDSDSSSNDESEVYRLVPTPRISQDQLASALLFAGSSSSQQTPNNPPAATGNNPVESQPSTSSTTATASGGQFITSSALNNALQNAFREASAVQPNQLQHIDGTEIASQGQPVVESDSMQEFGNRFASELLVMREMGLMDEARNVQMLILCGGDVAQAINLMLSESN